MDRRKRKTREAILRAFSDLLEKKRYDHITVQEIIDGADVGRSTFYAHFETKDMLLKALCSELFHPIFQEDPCPWVGRDSDLESRLAHILWHLRESRSDVTGILTSDSGELFMGYLREQLETVFEPWLDEFSSGVPRDFLLNHLVCSFAETARWWLRGDGRMEPEVMAGHFMRVVR